MRKLAGSFIEGAQSRLGIKIGSDHALWTWAAGHASWVLNRFQRAKGETPYEYGKSYKGLLAKYGEPVHGYIKSLNKGEPRWRLCLFLGKVERQDTYVLTGGAQVVLSKCVRSPNTCQSTKASMPTHGNIRQTPGAAPLPPKGEQKHCQQHRQTPREHVMVKFKDEDAEAVKAKALEGGSDSEKKFLWRQ